MNAVERYVHGLIKRNLRLKRAVVTLYQGGFSLFPLPRIRARGPVEVREGYFFGFHDKSPWSPDDRELLAHRALISNRTVQSGDEAEVGVFTGPGWTEYQPLARTKAWDWQLGSMLQWVGDTGCIVFNDHEEGCHVARILRSDGTAIRTLPRPVVALSPDGKHAASYNFNRVHLAMPGYGYAVGATSSLPDIGARASSLYLVDVGTGRSRELYSLQDMVDLDPHPSMEGAFHFFHHCLFSPGGRRFAFFHRWVEPNSRRWTRMYSCNLDGGELHRFPTSDMVSHIGWRDSDHILGFAAHSVKGDGYYLMKDRSNEVKVVGPHCFDSDGHPQYSPDRRFILTDTYPDRYRFQRLVIYDTKTRERRDIVRTRLPWRFRGPLQVDLHPRWSRSGTHVCFDSGHPGVRSLCTIPVESILAEAQAPS